MSRKFKCIYITGIAGSGKTSLCNMIQENNSKKVEILSYSKILMKNLQVTHKDLRAKSAKVVDSNCVENIDDEMINVVDEICKTKNVIIDSHSITKEDYGFRAKNFSFTQLCKLGIDIIIVLNASSNQIIQRMEINANNRKVVKEEEINQFINLQNSTALIYSVVSNCPIYFLKSDTLDDLKNNYKFILNLL